MNDCLKEYLRNSPKDWYVQKTDKNRNDFLGLVEYAVNVYKLQVSPWTAIETDIVYGTIGTGRVNLNSRYNLGERQIIQHSYKEISLDDFRNIILRINNSLYPIY